jgi:signal transduction histidine kinase
MAKEEAKRDMTLSLTTTTGVVGKIVEAYNNVQESLNYHQRMFLERERLAELGELSGEMAHEINTPLGNIIRSYAMIKPDLPTDDGGTATRAGQRIETACDIIGRITGSILDQVRNLGGSGNITLFNLKKVFDDTRMLLVFRIRQSAIKVNIQEKKDITLLADDSKLTQVLMNLVNNAIDAYADIKDTYTGEKTIDITSDMDDKNIIITVTDHAGGIPEHLREFVFRKILSTKFSKGTGLGLKVAYSVITAHFGGEIWFDTETGKGTTFHITLPLKQVSPNKQQKTNEQNDTNSG